MKSLPTSRFLRFLTIFMVGFPIFYIVMAVVLFELDSKGLTGVLLSPLFYLSSIFWVITGFGLRKMKKSSWYTFLFAQFFVAFLNVLTLLIHSPSHTRLLVFELTLLVQLYVHMIVGREMRVPYLFPKIHWWESGIAAMNHLVVDIDRANEKLIGQILDINLRGCFVKCPNHFEDFEKIKINCSAFGFNIELPGVVVWSAESAVTHPRGIGVRFYGLDRNKKKRLKTIANRFTKEKESPIVNKPKTA